MKPIESVVRFRSLTTPSKRLTVQNEGCMSGAGEGNRILCTIKTPIDNRPRQCKSHRLSHFSMNLTLFQ